jgi:leader peptidase (prepilin peptidase)/N-methyltransferase
VDLETLLALYVGAVGLNGGSYRNVVIHRLPRGISTVLPRSACPACGARVRARDNVPLLSFVLLRARCRDCGAPIPWRYPLVEAATAALFLLAFVRFGWQPELLGAMLFSAAMLALAGIDLEHFLLPDAITVPGILVGLALSYWLDWCTPLESAVGAMLGAGILLALIGAWYLLRGELGMGFGDVKMLAMIGAFLGAKGVLVALFFASLTGAATGVWLLMRHRVGLGAKLPFGVFLACGALVALYAGAPLLDAYGGLL